MCIRDSVRGVCSPGCFQKEYVLCRSVEVLSLIHISMVPAGIFVHCHHVKRESQEYYKSLQDNCRHNLVDHLVVQEISLQEEKKGFRAECRMQITRLAHSDLSLIHILGI